MSKRLRDGVVSILLSGLVGITLAVVVFAAAVQGGAL